ncbi:hypothetical protein I8748_19010 [Nostoc sp. CENA67]|uniref:Uncharacterized protein n=1 Tax=Amazonocrinis nigriterrae CENA67 TaxID=2794033 RepID=A0A8J7HRB7_9NOST|nr:hypothetical protein [Amazonocrinis nigriterrae]MBH8564252.1 hypothetical protein [Amazonocrinis nigriterrae CENA67]
MESVFMLVKMNMPVGLCYFDLKYPKLRSLSLILLKYSNLLKTNAIAFTFLKADGGI